MSTTTNSIAGIRIPDSLIARDATEFVQDVSTQLLFDHSRRVFLWGSLLGAERGLKFDPELLYVGAMFHDIGLMAGHRSEHERFEIDGANAARSFLERTGCRKRRSPSCGTRSHCTPRLRSRITSGPKSCSSPWGRTRRPRSPLWRPHP